MERDPGEFERREDETPPSDEDDVDRLIAKLPPCPAVSSTDDEIAAAVAEAREDVAAGRGIPDAQVAKWLQTLGTPDFRPMPAEWLK